MKSSVINVLRKIKLLISVLFSIYLTIMIFSYHIPNYILEMWDESEWWIFLFKIGFILFASYSLISVLMNDFVIEISSKTNKILLSAIGFILLAFLVGIFNYKHNDAILIFLIFIPLVIVIYFALHLKLDKITDYSYEKGCYDGFRKHIVSIGKSYEDGLNDGYNLYLRLTKNKTK